MQGKIIYTDSATETMVLAIAVFGKREFGGAAIISEAYRDVASGEWAAF